MGENGKKVKTLPTIWRIPDELWDKIRPIINQHDPPKHTGRKRIDPRVPLDTIIFRMRSDCQWNQLPKEFPDDSSVHRTFQRWIQLGVLDRVWAVLIQDCQKLGDVDWRWHAIERRVRSQKELTVEQKRRNRLVADIRAVSSIRLRG